jgi:uncharacterized lipoprotein YmbA
VHRFLSLTLLAALLSLAGCTSHTPMALYQLDSGNPVVPAKTDGIAVLLGPVTLADYLQRESLLQRMPDGSLQAATQARWAGSLSADVDQLLLRQLAARLDSQRLVLAPAGAPFAADVQVMLNISRLDSGPLQPAVLEAQWRLLDRHGQLRDSRLLRLEQAHAGSPGEQVQAQSLLLRQLVEQLAVAIEPLRNQAVAEPKPAPANKPRAQPKPQPDIPLIGPTRGNSEVLRF